MNTTNTIILGNGYVSQAYQNKGYRTISKHKFYYQRSRDFFGSSNFADLIHHINSFDNIVNCVAKADTNWTEDPSNFSDLWATNVEFVKELSEYCAYTGKKLIHISTTDLYGNLHDHKRNVESRRDLDLNTEYRFSKFSSERVCSPNDLILRIRLPFDDNPNPRNLLVKIQKFNKFFNLLTDLTYLPDLVTATEKLVDANQSDIFNVVSRTDTSILHIAQNLLDLPNARNLDYSRIITEFNMKNVYNICSVEKLSQFYTPTDLESSIINSFNNLTTKQNTL